jgi:hypothetical protein
MDKTSGTS